MFAKIKFPIYKEELSKFIYMALMLMLTIYVYSILRNTKDILLLSHLGAELISTTKLWSVLPSAVAFMLVYTKLANIATRTKIYHSFIWFFIGFFLIFDLLLYPNLDHLLLNMDDAIVKMPYMKYLLQMVAGWPVVLFYVLSELWGSVMMALMFWQLANQVTTITESKRFYPLFLLVGQAGLLMSGIFSMCYAEPGVGASVAAGKQNWQYFLHTMTTTLLVSGACLSLCLIKLEKLIGKETINDISKGSAKKKTKVRLGFGESLRYIFSSSYIGLIVLLVLCYGISINLVEGIWKASVNLHFASNKGAMQNFFGGVQVWTAIIGVVAMYSGSYILSLIKWRTGALLTPLMILVTGALFYVFIIYRGDGVLAPIIVALGMSPVYLAIIFGGMQNVLSKSIKYAFFDPTKEMSYIPLDEDLKTKGKAAVEVIGGRLGKSAGAAIQWGMLQVGYLFNPQVSLISLVSYFFIIFCVVLAIWIISVYGLAKKFEQAEKGEGGVEETGSVRA